MTLAAYSKLAIASLVVLTIGVGSATLPMLGPGNAHGADGVIDIELKPTKVAQRTNAFTPARARQPAAVAQQPQQGQRPQTQQSAATVPVAVSQTTGTNPLSAFRQNTSGFLSGNVTSSSDSKVSKEATNEVVEALIEALEDDNERVTHNAAKTLVSIGRGHSEVVAAFSEISADSKDKRLRYYAIAGLGRIGGSDQDASRSLTEVLERESDPVFRKAAVEALGRVQMTDEVARTLVAALRDTDATVRAAVAKVLGRLGPTHNSALRPRLSLPKELSTPVPLPGMDLDLNISEPSGAVPNEPTTVR